MQCCIPMSTEVHSIVSSGGSRGTAGYRSVSLARSWPLSTPMIGVNSHCVTVIFAQGFLISDGVLCLATRSAAARFGFCRTIRSVTRSVAECDPEQPFPQSRSTKLKSGAWAPGAGSARVHAEQQILASFPGRLGPGKEAKQLCIHQAFEQIDKITKPVKFLPPPPH